MQSLFLKKSRIILAALFILVTGVLLYSCYPDYGLSVKDYDMVLTLYDKDVDFAQFNTYAMPDTVLHPVPEGQTDDLSRAYDELILSTVVTNMQNMGYNRLTDTTGTAPDVLILVSALKSEWQVYNYYPGYWWGWYPWYPGYGWGWYPWYPGYGTSYSFSTGTILITMLDPENLDPDNNIVKSYWGAALNGLAQSDTPTGVRSRITTGINQAFGQSPYLKTN